MPYTNSIRRPIHEVGEEEAEFDIVKEKQDKKRAGEVRNELALRQELRDVEADMGMPVLKSGPLWQRELDPRNPETYISKMPEEDAIEDFQQALEVCHPTTLALSQCNHVLISLQILSQGSWLPLLDHAYYKYIKIYFSIIEF